MRIVSCVALAAVSVSCAEHRVPETEPREVLPHVSWELRTGTEESRSVCDSTKSSTPCVLQASTAQRDSEVTVHLFLHSAATEVRYSGVFQMPFLTTGGLSPAFKQTVPAGSRPVGRTITGRVTDKPGTYEMGIDLDVALGTSAAPKISQRVPVRVE